MSLNAGGGPDSELRISVLGADKKRSGSVVCHHWSSLPCRLEAGGWWQRPQLALPKLAVKCKCMVKESLSMSSVTSFGEWESPDSSTYIPVDGAVWFLGSPTLRAGMLI